MSIWAWLSFKFMSVLGGICAVRGSVLQNQVLCEGGRVHRCLGVRHPLIDLNLLQNLFGSRVSRSTRCVAGAIILNSGYLIILTINGLTVAKILVVSR
ncbi:hypothetical protein JTB14_032756 [Gonioctena quinquepunctata]|nr:hypothetical protein JTB14_032756 [Gonioctena quinquepunctata]